MNSFLSIVSHGLPSSHTFSMSSLALRIFVHVSFSGLVRAVGEGV